MWGRSFHKILEFQVLRVCKQLGEKSTLSNFWFSCLQQRESHVTCVGHVFLRESFTQRCLWTNSIPINQSAHLGIYSTWTVLSYCFALLLPFALSIGQGTICYHLPLASAQLPWAASGLSLAERRLLRRLTFCPGQWCRWTCFLIRSELIAYIPLLFLLFTSDCPHMTKVTKPRPWA